jgi:HlyD family secretion protein
LQRAVDVGQTVAASLQAPVIFTIAQDLSRMEVHAAIDEADVGKLREGQEASFTVDAYPGETFRGSIFQIRSQPTVTQNVVTYDAVLRVDNKEAKLRPGMTAAVRAVSQRHEGVLRIPNSALRFRPAADIIERSADASPGGGGAGGGPDAGAPRERPRRGLGAPGGGGAGPGGGAGVVAAAGAPNRWAKAYLARGTKVAAVRFRPGIADDEFTEVREGSALHEGDEVVIDVAGGPQGAAPAGGGQRGRGPRLF